MRLWSLALAVLFAGALQNWPIPDWRLIPLPVVAQAPDMPPPGNPGHQAPPKDAYCSRETHAAHHCECAPTCMEGRDEDGNSDGTMHRMEDNAKCRAACFPHSCLCAASCEA